MSERVRGGVRRDGFGLGLAACAGVLALAGCDRLARVFVNVDPDDPTPGTSASAGAPVPGGPRVNLPVGQGRSSMQCPPPPSRAGRNPFELVATPGPHRVSLAVFTAPVQFDTPRYEAYREGGVLHVVEHPMGSPMTGRCAREVALEVTGVPPGRYVVRLSRAQPTGALSPLATTTALVPP